ncbi:MAG: hypothetical protein ACRDSH_04070 [Pseudonocardiaceae bacterium]
MERPTIISYAAAASRLNGLDPFETDEQLRDWARTGLASHLELDTARFRDAAYDTLPVREAAFADLSRQLTGPGRALFDGHGVLHVLVPRGDPHESRTIGLAIDQYRTDAGADPPQVQVDHYQLHPRAQTIELIPEKPAPTSEVRQAHGFVTMRIDEMKGLTDFLARTRHLSWLEARGSEVWAGGWNWPDVPATPLDAKDVLIIQRGYLDPSSGQTPGFSLDPGPPATKEDILAVLPGLRPDFADRLISHDWTGSSFGSAEKLAAVVHGALWDNNPSSDALAGMGLPSDRTQLWSLYLLLAGRPGYSQARYDGRLEGTKVGMTLFYTDHIAKDWVHSGVGTGVPTRAVGGFIPNSAGVTPWSHCAGSDFSKLETGRLWFGQNDSAFAFDGARVSIGAQSTRLFSRSDNNGGTEVEPSFTIGRGMTWWDQHYQTIADYEPQYQRLEEIMRWSGALDWLASKTQAKLPQLNDSADRSDLRFKNWYTQHNELRERSPIDFVTPPSAEQEAIRENPSAVFKDCGIPLIAGGVSLGDLIQRKGGRSFRPDLPESIHRGGLYEEASRFDPTSGTGQITQVSIDSGGRVGDSLQRTFSTTADGHAIVDVAASGRRVISLQSLKAWLADTAPRKLKVEFAAGRGQISERVEFQGEELGRQEVRKYAGPGFDTVTVQWKRGPLDRILRILNSTQDRLTAQPAAGVPTAKDGVLYSYQDGGGRIVTKTGGPDAPWLTITNEITPPGEDLAFRLGAPDPRTGTAQFFLGKRIPRPELPPGTDGAPPWMEITHATGDHPAQAHVVGPPGSDAHPVRVNTPEGRDTTLYQIGDHAVVRLDDPILGFNGTAEGAALLRDYPRVAQAMRDAGQAKDRLVRGVSLDGDGVALADVDGVTLAAADHSWADRVLAAIAYDPSRQVPLFRKDGGHLLHLDPSPLTVAPGSTRRTTLGEARDTAGSELYLNRSMLVVEKGVIIADALPRDTKVTVRSAVVADRPSAERTAIPPDIRTYGGGEWWRPPQTIAGSGGSPPPSTTPNPPGSGGVGSAPGGQILLVCPDSNDKPPGCEE